MTGATIQTRPNSGYCIKGAISQRNLITYLVCVPEEEEEKEEEKEEEESIIYRNVKLR